QADRHRQHRKPLEGPALPRLCLRERRARGALGEVLVEALALLARETAVALLREGELRALARDEVLDLLRERPARAEEQRLESAGREPEKLCDLDIRPSLELAHDKGLAL